MTGPRAGFAVLALLALAALAPACAPRTEEAPPKAEAPETPMVVADGDQVRLRLYFPGGGGLLVLEERDLPVEGAGADLRAIAAQVLAGPETPGLYPPFPAGTDVGSVFVSESGIAYVDLVSTDAGPPSSGSRQEMLSVYSVVNSIAANLPDLEGVVLLWNGQQRRTFAGHLDTGRPLEENPQLVAR